MCGFIVGFINNKSNIQKVLPPTDTFNHRGPDSFSKIINEKSFFYFWRLSIVDRFHGQQPIEDIDNKVTIVFNGEIYNYKKLRKILEQKGHSFKTDSDSEVVLKSYIHFGSRCFDLFEGMFAICISDKKNNKLVVSTDTFGIKPLYFTNNNGTLIFASEQKGIFAGLGGQASLNKSAIYDYLLYQHVTNEETLFDGVSKLSPGSIVEYSLDNLLVLNSSKIKIKSIGKYNSYKDYKQSFREIVLEQFMDALDTDLDVTFQLSGGIDSNLLVGLASKYAPEKLNYTVSSFVEGNFDSNESDFIKRVVSDLKVENELIPINSKIFFSELRNSIRNLGEPTGDAGVVAQFIVNKQTSKKTKIAIAGQGADEMFFGYIRNYLAYLHHKGNLNAANIANDPFLSGWESYASSFINKHYSNSKNSYFNKMSRFNFSDEMINKNSDIINKIESIKLNNFNKLNAQCSSLNHFMLFSELNYQLPPLLQMEDRASMSSSIETRVPLCTNSILSLALEGTADWKFHNGKTKGIIRDVFSDVIPSYILNRRQKVGRPIPLKKWIYSKHGEEYYRNILDSKEMISDIFGFDFVTYALNNPNPYDRSLWMVLSFSIWIDEFQISV